MSNVRKYPGAAGWPDVGCCHEKMLQYSGQELNNFVSQTFRAKIID